MARFEAASRSRSWVVVWIVSATTLVAAWGAMNVPRAIAQDEDVIDDYAAAPAADTPPAQSETAPPAANGADTTDAAEVSPAAPPKQSYLGWLYAALGPLYSIIFLCLSFALVAFTVMNVLTARRDNILPPELIEGFEAPA